MGIKSSIAKRVSFLMFFIVEIIVIYLGIKNKNIFIISAGTFLATIFLFLFIRSILFKHYAFFNKETLVINNNLKSTTIPLGDIKSVVLNKGLSEFLIVELLHGKKYKIHKGSTDDVSFKSFFENLLLLTTSK